jgi:hypothetical protein
LETGSARKRADEEVRVPDDTRDDRWLRERISQILEHGWSIEELEEIGITRSILTRLGFRDDHPRLFERPKPRTSTKAASRSSGDAASRF